MKLPPETEPSGTAVLLVCAYLRSMYQTSFVCPEKVNGNKMMNRETIFFYFEKLVLDWGYICERRNKPKAIQETQTVTH